MKNVFKIEEILHPQLVRVKGVGTFAIYRDCISVDGQKIEGVFFAPNNIVFLGRRPRPRVIEHDNYKIIINLNKEDIEIDLNILQRVDFIKIN